MCDLLCCRKNNGDVSEMSTPNGYTLTFQCPKDIYDEMRKIWQTVESGIFTHSTDLASMFTSYSGMLDYWVSLLAAVSYSFL